MEETIFRKASIDRVSSPEQLNDYISVSTPSVWLILAAALVMLLAFFVWAIKGDLPTTVKAVGMAQGGQVVCYLPSEDAAQLKPGAEATLGTVKGSVTAVAQSPLSYEEAAETYQSDYTIHMLALGDWNYPVTIEAPVADGLHELTIVAESVRPIHFLIN